MNNNKNTPGLTLKIPADIAKTKRPSEIVCLCYSDLKKNEPYEIFLSFINLMRSAINTDRILYTMI